MSAPQDFWQHLLDINKRADGLIKRVLGAVEPYQPISREIPIYGEVEVRFDNLPVTFASTVSPNSDILSGNNVKQGQWTNKGSRVYINQMSMVGWLGRTVSTGALVINPRDERNSEIGLMYPLNWRWNFMTSISQRMYSNAPGKRCLATSMGRQTAGNRISFREPLVIEPMETFTLEVELLAAGMNVAEPVAGTRAIISCQMSGYREGM